jgi:hypothetical protein
MIVVNTNVVFDWFRRFNTVGSAAKGVTNLKVFYLIQTLSGFYFLSVFMSEISAHLLNIFHSFDNNKHFNKTGVSTILHYIRLKQ